MKKIACFILLNFIFLMVIESLATEEGKFSITSGPIVNIPLTYMPDYNFYPAGPGFKGAFSWAPNPYFGITTEIGAWFISLSDNIKYDETAILTGVDGILPLDKSLDLRIFIRSGLALLNIGLPELALIIPVHAGFGADIWFDSAWGLQIEGRYVADLATDGGVVFDNIQAGVLFAYRF